MDVGAELRQAREQRALSLQDLSRRTKISLPALRAIENNEVDRLPGGIFTRGFVKAYAREVGLDPVEISRRYVAQFEPPAEPPVAPPVPAQSVEEDATAEEDAIAKSPAPERLERTRIAAVLAVLALVAVSYLEFSRSHVSNVPEGPRSSDRRSVVKAAPQAVVSPGREIVATSGSLDITLPPTQPSPLVLRVDLQPPVPCWISATADGTRVTYRVLSAGERQTIEVRNEIVLRVGDPSRLAFSLNGSAARLPGPAGQPATARITPGNYRDFLAAK